MPLIRIVDTRATIHHGVVQLKAAQSEFINSMDVRSITMNANHIHTHLMAMSNI